MKENIDDLVRQAERKLLDEKQKLKEPIQILENLQNELQTQFSEQTKHLKIQV